MPLVRHCRRVPALVLPLLIGLPVAAAQQSTTDRFVRTLASIRAVQDAEPRASLLLDLLEDCAPSTCPEPPDGLLAEAAMTAEAVQKPSRRVELLVRLARLQQRLGLAEEAAASLMEASRTAQAMEGEQKNSQLLRLSLAYGALDGEEDAAAALAAAMPGQTGTSKETTPSFPFTPELTQVDLGFAISGASYQDTTALAAINLDLYSQAARQDLDIDLMVSADYDSSRDYNNIRPHSQIILVYRRHLNRRWNLFFDQLVSVNADTFASEDNDEDLSVLSASFVGAGLNLWRGEDPASFIEVQIGAGVRYEYEYIDFQQRRNEAYPAPVLALRSRELPVGSGRLNQILAMSNSMRDWDNFFVWSASQLKFPLGNNKKWWWSNELILRYRNLPVIKSAPSVTAIFSTGLTYSF